MKRAASIKPVTGTNGSGRVVSEIIGRTTSPYARITTWRKSVDATKSEYTFWSHLRRGKEPGYELGALFADRIAEIDAEWTLGDGFIVETGNETVDEECAAFVDEHLDEFMTWRKDASAHGDAYLIVNPDASLSMANPDCVDILTDDLDYTRVVGYRITTVLDKVTATDEYRLDGRTVTFKTGDMKIGAVLVGMGYEQTSVSEYRREYANLTGMLPVIHLPNDREANEVYGHPIYEALLKLFARYDDVLNKSLDGVEVMGRPIPVAEGLEDPEEAMRANSTRTEDVTDKDGATQTVPVVDFEDLTMLWLGKGGSFKFAGPGSFSADSVAMLKKLFYLMLEHTGIIEAVWGGAIASSKASVDAQMPAFVKYLKGRRTATTKAVQQLVTVWLAMKRLTTPLAALETVKIHWPSLESEDEALKLNKLNAAHDRGVIRDETYLRLLDIVDDPAAEVEAAKAEGETDESRLQEAVDREMAMMRNEGGGEMGDMDAGMGEGRMQREGAAA